MNFKDECQKLLDRYAACYRTGDAQGCASVYSLNAKLYSPFGPPAIGRDAIEATHEEWVQEDAEEKKINVISAGCEGNLGWCVANFSEGSTGNGSSLNVLSRQMDGNWLITLCSLNESQKGL